ncbi:pseudoazurin [Roseibium sp. HPY-6]|uniref:pseudoazurin n=1 Tax=Roseibium sp. HPY-6 TaxID=3229852 RepID=UPI00339009E7
MLTRRNFVFSVAAMAGAGSALACPAPEATGNAHGILMLNAACGDPDTPNVFEPAILRINTGDNVTFVPTDAGHNSASKRGMIPDGAEPWNGAIDENLTVNFTVPGIYGHICVPHYEWGMVGLIVVGNDFSNFKSARKIRHPGSARKVFRALLKELEAEA